MDELGGHVSDSRAVRVGLDEGDRGGQNAVGLTAVTAHGGDGNLRQLTRPIATPEGVITICF